MQQKVIDIKNSYKKENNNLTRALEEQKKKYESYGREAASKDKEI